MSASATQGGHNQTQAHSDILRSALYCQSNKTCASIANLPNSAQLQGTPYHSPKLHPGPCSSVGMRWKTDRQTHRCPWPIHILLQLCLIRNVTKQTVQKKNIRICRCCCELVAEVTTLESFSSLVNSTLDNSCCIPHHIKTVQYTITNQTNLPLVPAAKWHSYGNPTSLLSVLRRGYISTTIHTCRF